MCWLQTAQIIIFTLWLPTDADFELFEGLASCQINKYKALNSQDALIYKAFDGYALRTKVLQRGAR